MNKERFLKLDGLRGLFALSVSLYHYPSQFVPDFFFNFFFVRSSWLFVDFFFVLSGFVIALNYNQIQSFDALVVFCKKRFIRIYPLLFYSVIIFLISYIILFYFLPNYVNYFNSNNATIQTFESLLLLNSTPILGTGTGINGPSWSISSEFLCYFLFGIFSLVFFKKNILYKTYFYLLTLLVSVLSLLIIGDNGIHYTSDLGFLRGFYGFFIGALLHMFYSKNKISVTNSFIEPISMGLIIGALYITHYFIFFSFLVPPIFGVVIYLLLNSNGPISRFFEKKVFVFLGDISYSVYLNHSIVITIITKLFFDFFMIPNTLLFQIIIFIFCILFLILYSVFTRRYIELNIGKRLGTLFKLKKINNYKNQ